MIKDEMEWLHSNKCRYCGNELPFITTSERLICKICGRINYKNKKVKFHNELKKKLIREKRKNNER